MPNASPSVIENLCQIKSLSELTEGQRAVVMAVRTCVLANMQGQCCCGHLAQYLGSAHSAGSFVKMMRSIVVAWPEALVVHRLLSAKTSYDEVLIVDLIMATIKNDTQLFYSMLRDMMPKAVIFSIQSAIREFVDTLPGREIGLEA